MKNGKTIDILNKLLEINNDRLDGYETALNETEEHDLKTMLARLARTSHRNGQELSAEIIRLGGTPTESTKTTGKLFRAWMDVKAAFARKDPEAIVSSCEFGEDAALETYKEVLSGDLDYLSNDQQTLVRVQYSLLKADHRAVHALRDVLASKS
jgi:uncharacterized protein (TIGR02284 family)